MQETAAIALTAKPAGEVSTVAAMHKPMWSPSTIDLRLLSRLSVRLRPTPTPSPTPNPIPTPAEIETTPPPSATTQSLNINLIADLHRLLIASIQSILPQSPAPAPATALNSEPGCALPLFRPYVAKVPWHGGARAFLSGFFPRYGHYCGPNWSSGKDGGSMLWDRRPIDWLDHCCYCHDIGYDSHDQAALLKADLAFLNCLERPRMATKGGTHAALLYRAMCIAGLRHMLIPYRSQLVRLQRSGFSFGELIGNLARGRRDTVIRQG